MKDPSGAIRLWLYGVLSTKVSYGGSVVPVYSFPTKDAAKPYILIAEQTSPGEDGTKDCYISKHSITVEVYCSSNGTNASYVPLNTIADSTLQLIRTRTKITGLTGFNVVSIVYDGGITDRIDFDNEIILIKVLNFTLTIAEE